MTLRRRPRLRPGAFAQDSAPRAEQKGPRACPWGSTRLLKIVHFLTDQNWTALTEEVFTLCCELTRRGHHVWIFCVPALHGLLAKKDIEHGVVIKDHLRLDLRYPIHTVIDIYRLRGFLIDERPDILHVHCSDDYWIGALANRYAATTTRLVKTLHEPSNLRLRTIHRWLYTTLTNAFVTLCKEDSRKLKQSYNIKSKPVASFTVLLI